MKKSYLPVGDVNLANWYNNFSAKMVSQYGQILGFSAAELADMQNDNNVLQQAVQYRENLRQAAIAMTAYLKQLRNATSLTTMGAMPVLPAAPAAVQATAGIFTRLAIYVRRIKLSPAYNEAIGQDLDIIMPGGFGSETSRPDLAVKVLNGYPVIRYKREKADGIFLYVDRRDGNGFTLIDKLVGIEYTDTSPLPPATYSVTWDYKARFMKNDKEIGLFSEIVAVNIVRVEQ